VEEIKKKVAKVVPQIVLAEEAVMAPQPPAKLEEEHKQVSPPTAKHEVSVAQEELRLQQKMDKMFQER